MIAKKLSIVNCSAVQVNLCPRPNGTFAVPRVGVEFLFCDVVVVVVVVVARGKEFRRP